MPFRARPIWFVAAALAAGSAIAAVAGVGVATASICAAVAAACAVYAMCVPQKAPAWILIAIALAAVARAAIIRTPDADDISILAGSPAIATIDGTVGAEPEHGPKFVHFPLRVSQAASGSRNVEASGLLQVYIDRRVVPAGIEYGTNLRVQSRLEEPKTASERGRFSQKYYLERRGIFAVVWIRDRDQVKLLTSNLGSGLTRRILAIRRNWISVYTSRLPEREAGLVSGMLLGDYGLVDPGLIDSFRASGTLHLLAASGFNCAVIVYLLWFQILRRAKAPRQASLLLVMCAVGAYVVMVGGKPSIMRAGIGAGLYLLAQLLGRPARAASVLFATAAVLLVINPLSIAEIGFQLSFAAVGSILAFASLLHPAFSSDGTMRPASFPGWVRTALVESLVITTAATLGTWPIIAHHFGTLSLVSLPANAVAAILAVVLFEAAAALAVVSWVPGVELVLSWIVYLLAAMVAAAITWFGDLPYAQIEVASPGLFVMAAYYAGLMYAWLALRSTIRNRAQSRASVPIEAADQVTFGT